MRPRDPDRAPWTDGTIDGAGVRLAARDYGGRGPCVVLVHGGPGQNLATWDTFVPHLRGEVRVVALDMRGNGASGDAADYSYNALASDIAAVVAHYRLRRPVIVGHSWGGQIAVAYAGRYKNCGGIACVDGWVTDVRDPATEETWEELERAYNAESFFSFGGDAAEFDRTLAAIAEMHGVAGAAVARRQMHADEGGVYRWRRSVRQLLEVERKVDEAGAALSTSIYAAIRCPVLLIGAEHSERERDPRWGPWGFSRSATEPVVERYERVRCEWWPCGHDIPQLMPERLAAAVLGFAFSVSQAASRLRGRGGGA